MHIKVERFAREDVIKELDPGSVDASIASLNKVVSELQQTPAQNQLVTQQPTTQIAIADSLDKVSAILATMDKQLQLIDEGNENLTLQQRAELAVSKRQEIISQTQSLFKDNHVRTAFAQLMPQLIVKPIL